MNFVGGMDGIGVMGDMGGMMYICFKHFQKKYRLFCLSLYMQDYCEACGFDWIRGVFVPYETT
ncbi:hypothetical protein KQI74_14890 [Paenibacillus barcinonensis]|uniref:hypothetical protein n=1 Tax=Paenibacillus TaxID=44249 RepID=UPI001C1263FE|nr:MULTISPECIES: hypothetical protein [Paenibacillus]MBU5353579.1 hypothetical protein [Paenibacillus barcinonensis]MDM5279450.1 hypothetical protein [Paenibacillus silvae]